MCFGDKNCACPVLNQFAADCATKGINTAGWALTNPNVECAPTCPEGSTYKAAGPKPAPSCAKASGGRKTQAGCFCPQGQVMENGECIDVGDCQCEYAGVRYEVRFLSFSYCDSISFKQLDGSIHVVFNVNNNFAQINDKYEKADTCQSCKCVGNGVDECKPTKCDVQCAEVSS